MYAPAGDVAAYQLRLDLRAVYEYVCRKHPAAGEPQYPLWHLPLDSTLTREDVATRVRDCTGVGLPAAQRTPEQAARLRGPSISFRATISGTAHWRTLVSHLTWAIWLCQDLKQKRLGDRNPFGSVGAPCEAEALDAGVARYAADPQAQEALAADNQPTGPARRCWRNAACPP